MNHEHRAHGKQNWKWHLTLNVSSINLPKLPLCYVLNNILVPSPKLGINWRTCRNKILIKVRWLFMRQKKASLNFEFRFTSLPFQLLTQSNHARSLLRNTRPDWRWHETNSVYPVPVLSIQFWGIPAVTHLSPLCCWEINICFFYPAVPEDKR